MGENKLLEEWREGRSEAERTFMESTTTVSFSTLEAANAELISLRTQGDDLYFALFQILDVYQINGALGGTAARKALREWKAARGL